MSVSPHRLVHRFGLLALGLTVAALGLAPSPAGATGINNVLINADDVQPQGSHVAVKLSAGAAEVVSAVAGGNVRKGGHSFQFRPARATVAATRQATLELRPRKGWQERKILSALHKGKTLIATVHVRVKDFIGNTATRTLTIRLT